MSFRTGMVESERAMGQGHLNDLYREAEVNRTLRRENRPRLPIKLNLAAAQNWLIGKLVASEGPFRRFVTPCGQLTLWPAKVDC